MPSIPNLQEWQQRLVDKTYVGYRNAAPSETVS